MQYRRAEVRLTIQFVNESLALTGGFRVVLEHATRLIRRGHAVRLLAPPIRAPRPGASLAAWRGWLYRRFSGSIEDGLRSYGMIGAVQHIDPSRCAEVPAGDAVVATAWPTAEWVADMPERAGRKYYLVQQYEAWAGADPARVDRTWTLPLRKIVIAGWLERLATERFGSPAWARVPNGVDGVRFHPVSRRAGSPVVGMLYDLQAWKGADDGIEALWSVHRAHPEARFLLFGRHRMRHRPPPGSRYVRDPRQQVLPRLYASMDVFLNASHSEGFSLVILEAMASGVATVATAVGEVPDMGTPGRDYLMVPAKDTAALAMAVSELLSDSERRESVATAGLALAGRYTWDGATDLFERALVRGAA